MDSPAGPDPDRLRPSRLLVGTATSPGAGLGPVVRPGDGPLTGGVVVARDLGPGEVNALDRGAVQALATVGGAPLSHAAIIARSLGIPAVAGLGPEILELAPGTVVLVDGDAGTVDLAPPPGAVEAVAARRRAAARQQAEWRRLAGGPALTRDGRPVAVLANVGGPHDAEVAVEEGADGVGMLRTEFAFLDRADPPDEEEQYLAYRSVADALGERPLVLRTLDLGGDIPAWGAAPEPNPALGNRGLRFSLSMPGVLETQLRAVARLGRERPVRVMFPMVTTVDELRRARACLDGVLAGQPGSRLEVGITIEVPAAAVTADAFAPLVDFFSVGTNDLTQYTLAADRANAAVAGLADGLHPAVLRLVRAVAAAGRLHGRTVGTVGELGCDPAAVAVLVGLGVDSLSVRPNAVAAVKQLVRAVVAEEAASLALAALEADSAEAVRRLVAGAGAGAGAAGHDD
ncbi:MAG TPA: phosphoenolpyruvate--protein phosphotransferase [Acidimicrobiales bacterium]|nr:phosphoenolpyruvate--protein phosphotransferase [Acidimicrobiales bacterium]